MAIQRYALVNAGLVTNVVLWDGVSAYSPGGLLVQSNTANVGDSYDGTTFTPGILPIPQGIMFTNSPATGATIILPNAPQPQGCLYVVLTPAIALIALTLNLPPSPIDGDILYIVSTKAITGVTPVITAGQALINIPSPFPLTAGTSQHIVWSAQLASWFRL
jgi:hypothetical protein